MTTTIESMTISGGRATWPCPGCGKEISATYDAAFEDKIVEDDTNLLCDSCCEDLEKLKLPGEDRQDAEALKEMYYPQSEYTKKKIRAATAEAEAQQKGPQSAEGKAELSQAVQSLAQQEGERILKDLKEKGREIGKVAALDEEASCRFVPGTMGKDEDDGLDDR